MARTRNSDPAGAGQEGAALFPPRLVGALRHNLTNVLIIGGTVLQRDRVARTFHRESPLRAGPFVSVDCGADRERLSESLRAWSATEPPPPTHPFQEAEAGTLYLERVEDLLPATQPLLLALAVRLQGEPVGDPSWPCAGRLVVGNPLPLTGAVSEGRFDPTLYDALAKVQVDLGPGVHTGNRG